MEIDYNKIGLKSGLEIHQQLNTHKLFCECPSELRKDEPKFIVQRKLHAVAGETGDVDIAVKFEAERDRDFVYQGYDTTCLVELDEEPPHKINQEALNIAIQIALLLNCKIIPVTQIMRKTVIDGSNTSGFQRTVFIAQNGYIDTSEGRIRITGVALEEDAARIIEKRKDAVIYRLDRLGIPLVEIATEPDITSPSQAKEAALKIGEILRACEVKRGLGTIRQDVNMSVKGGSRIEIKGFQDIKNIEKTIEGEIERQLKLIKEKKSVAEVRRANDDRTTTFLRPLPGKARMYPETDLPLLKISREKIDEIKKTLPKLKSEIHEELKSHGLSIDEAKLLTSTGKVEDYKVLRKIYDNGSLIVNLLVVWPKEIASKKRMKYDDVYEKIQDITENILEDLKKGKIVIDDIKDIMTNVVDEKGYRKAVALEEKEAEDIEDYIKKIVKEKPGLSVNAYMGLVMQKFKGKVNGKEIIEILKKYIK